MPLEIVRLSAQGDKGFLAELSDGREMRLSAASVADFSLYKGRELSNEELCELEGAVRFSKCRERAFRIIGARPMSAKELFDRLVEKGESPEDAENCVEWLLERRYLDDVEYAAMVVRHYSAKGYGAARIKNELYRRGVAKSLWDDALAEMPEQDDKIYKLLCAKLKSGDPDRAEMKRATDALYRRGYSWDEIKTAVSRYKTENLEQD